LKTCPELWQRASTCSVSANDTEIVLPLAIPVVTASLVIQFSELTESRQNQELHCPRCILLSFLFLGFTWAFQDPFLCQSCGFCKYARMDISLVCRPLPGVQPITTDAERASVSLVRFCTTHPIFFHIRSILLCVFVVYSHYSIPFFLRNYN
uniref:Secreted protein n=1 Tax=Haemonchus placei TaxID=6290 RepID=A0A0N4WVI6_HAEPC